MRPQNIVERFLDWVEEWYSRLSCPHYQIVTNYTMEQIMEDKWERVGGAAECRDCHRYFQVSVCANETERDNKYNLNRATP